MQISRELAKRINAEPGMKAVLVRDRDIYIDHRDRMAIARRHKADLFVSIHADAVDDRRAHGASVYALSLKGASDEAARQLAQRENASATRHACRTRSSPESASISIRMPLRIRASPWT